MNNHLKSFNLDLSATSPLGLVASSPAALVDALGILFMHGAMDPNLRSIVIGEVGRITDIAQRVRVATYLVLTSSQFKNLH